MSHFWVQFSSDVAVFGRRCQSEILIVTGSFQKDWHFVDHHLVDLCMRAMLIHPPKIIVVNRDLRISQCLLICCWSKLLICWSIGTDSLVIFRKNYPSQSLKSYASHISRFHVWWNVTWQTSPAWVEFCTICRVYFAHTGLQTKHTVNKKHHIEKFRVC